MSLVSQNSLASAHVPIDKRAEIADRREALFRETIWQTCRRVALGATWSLMPSRAGQLWPLARLWLSDLVSPRRGLPDPDMSAEMGEFAGIVHDLSPTTLIAAYRRGLFPLTHFGPLKWMSPRERCVLHFDEFHISRRLRAMLRQEKYTVTFDRDFESVIKACASPRKGRLALTWITPRIMRAYAELYDAGCVHSFEVWNRAGELVGGGYGVALGRIFIIESLFSRETNTSKYGLTMLNWHLAKWGFQLNDNKWATPTTLQMGFRRISRAEYLHELGAALAGERPRDRFEVEASPKTVADWNLDEGSNAGPETAG
ncbi:MAG: leucyl/phenylalanyl-tRNA--protein transferase [Methyloceanibacter sp.]|jgi:leucyl/phenylalanyl-tRNA--protein transferase|nr:leucyl/phenylalanyl-tRNA--protein transferase [Methyloceanibacter sp.]